MAQKASHITPAYKQEVTLLNGSQAVIRLITAADKERLLAFFNRLSPETRYLRFHYTKCELSENELECFCDVDYNNTLAIVAKVLREQFKDIIAIGRYYRLPNKHSAEVAFVIEDGYQGRGIGTRLVEWLANIARDNGITTFEADVLAENEEMMAVFRDYGFHIMSELEAGVYHVTFPIALPSIRHR